MLSVRCSALIQYTYFKNNYQYFNEKFKYNQAMQPRQRYTFK